MSSEMIETSKLFNDVAGAKSASRWMLKVGRWILVFVFACLLTARTNAATTVVQMRSIQFQPPNIVINFGDTVVWTNLDSQQHNTVSGTNLVRSGYWASPLFGRGGTFSVTFTNIPPGGYGYYCEPHLQLFGMKGTITVNGLPTSSITVPANNASVPANIPFAITAAASDADGTVVRVDFFADGNLIGSSSGPSFSVSATLAAGPHVLTAVVVDDLGATSISAAVNVTAVDSPAILSPPQSTNVVSGGSVEFSVVAAGAPPLTFQWQFNGVDIPGATNSTLVISNATTSNDGNYIVVVSNPFSSVASPPAKLTVSQNQFPNVSIASPTNGAVFGLSSIIDVKVDANDPDGFVTQVVLTVTNLATPIVPFLVLTNAPFMLTNLSAGDYSLTAKATDNEGAVSTSSTVSFAVLQPITASITSPTNDQHFLLGSAITLRASVTPPQTRPTSVFFLANGQFVPTNVPWIPLQPARYTLFAVATNAVGQRATSAPVGVRVFFPADNVKPTVAITNGPANFARITNATATLAGTASDNNTNIDVVRVAVDGLAVFDANGTDVWNATVPLLAGQNHLRVWSVDFAGNRSAEITRYITRVVNGQLTVVTNGQGKVTPDLTRSPLEIGKVYSLTALPAAGHIFKSWDVATSQGARLNFLMLQDLKLTVNFTANPFPKVQGTYSGLVQNTNGVTPPVLDTNGVTPETSGLVTLQVGNLGVFSGRLVLAGVGFPLNGQFTPEGEWHTALLRTGQRPLAIKLQLDLTNGTDTVSGSVSSSVTNGLAVGSTNGANYTDWTSELLANRNTFNAMTNRAPSTGAKVFPLLGTDNSTNATLTANIAPGGTVTIACLMSDGRRFSSSATLAKNGDYPFYISMNSREAMGGWLNFSPPPVIVTGRVNWVRSGTNTFAFELRP
jgi:plastocyanin